MKLLGLFCRRKHVSGEELKELAKPPEAHKKAIDTIEKTRKEVDNLKQVLEENGVTLKISKAVGHK